MQLTYAPDLTAYWCNCQSLAAWEGPYHPLGDTLYCPSEDVVQVSFDCLPEMDEDEAWKLSATIAVEMARQRFLAPKRR